MTIITFLFFTALVAILTWWFTRGTDVSTNEGYFLAGRSLTGVFIAGSLLLTNLSTEQLVGLNGGAFNDGLSLMCWEVIAGISLVIMGLFFLPKYLKSGITTVPQYLEERFGARVRAVAAMIFIVAYMLVLLPFVLYSGSKALISMLDLKESTGLTEYQLIWIVISAIALLGGAYAILGGLKAIAVSDTFNGAGLLVGGLLVTVLAWNLVADLDGSYAAAYDGIKSLHDGDALQSMGKADEGTYWPTLFTGVLLLNFFYWSSNQQIIQRTFGAKNLAEGQKGVLIAAFFKILAPLILIIPGIIAAYLVIEKQDAEMMERVGQKLNEKTNEMEWDTGNAYGALVTRVLPPWLLGFFAAVIVGSILSTFNSVLNSAATLFSLDVYKKYINTNANTQQVVRAGQICSILVGLLAVIASPLVFYGREKGIFDFFQSLNGVYFIPLLAILLVGLFNKTINEKAALITLFTGVAIMIVGTFFSGGDNGWVNSIFANGFHFMGAVFALLIVLQFVLGAMGLRRDKPFAQKESKAVDITPWKHAKLVGGTLIVFALFLYVFFAF